MTAIFNFNPIPSGARLIDGQDITALQVAINDVAAGTIPPGAFTGSYVVSNGLAVSGDTTTGHTWLLQAYDVDGAAYKTFVTFTNGNIPSMAIAAPLGGAATMNGVVIGGTVAAAASVTTLTISDGSNIVLSGTTGTKIGTATTQKLAFYNSAPVVQPAGASVTTAGFTAGLGAAVLVDSTFTGNTGSTAYHISDIVANLKSLGLLAA